MSDSLSEWKRPDVLKQIEGEYFLDYAIFTGAVREYVARTLEMQFRTDPNDWHRRLFLIAVFREEFSAYEDLGALLDAFLRTADDATGVPLDGLIRYKPSKVVLRNVFERYKIVTGADLFERLHLSSWIPAGWSLRYPNIDLEKVLRVACAYFVKDCAANQTQSGIFGFNKVKHGLLLAPSARRYISSSIDVPALLHECDPAGPDAKTLPVTVQAVPFDDAAIEQRMRVIHFIQIDTRILALLYVVKRWPEWLAGRGFAAPLDAFDHPNLRDLHQVMTEITEKL